MQILSGRRSKFLLVTTSLAASAVVSAGVAARPHLVAAQPLPKLAGRVIVGRANLPPPPITPPRQNPVHRIDTTRTSPPVQVGSVLVTRAGPPRPLAPSACRPSLRPAFVRRLVGAALVTRGAADGAPATTATETIRPHLVAPTLRPRLAGLVLVRHTPVVNGTLGLPRTATVDRGPWTVKPRAAPAIVLHAVRPGAVPTPVRSFVAAKGPARAGQALVVPAYAPTGLPARPRVVSPTRTITRLGAGARPGAGQRPCGRVHRAGLPTSRPGPAGPPAETRRQGRQNLVAGGTDPPPSSRTDGGGAAAAPRQRRGQRLGNLAAGAHPRAAAPDRPDPPRRARRLGPRGS